MALHISFEDKVSFADFARVQRMQNLGIFSPLPEKIRPFHVYRALQLVEKDIKTSVSARQGARISLREGRIIGDSVIRANRVENHPHDPIATFPSVITLQVLSPGSAPLVSWSKEERSAYCQEAKISVISREIRYSKDTSRVNIQHKKQTDKIKKYR